MRHASSSLLAGGMILQQGSNFILGVAVAQSLGPLNYGTFSVLRTLAIVITTLAPLGLDLAVLKHAALGRADAAFERDFAVLRTLATASSFLLAISSFFLSFLFVGQHSAAPDGLSAILASYSVLPMTDIAILSALGRAKGQAVRVSIVADYAVAASRTFMALVVWQCGGNLSDFFLANAVIVSLAAVVLHLALGSVGPMAIHYILHFKSVLHYLRESSWMALSLASHMLARFLDILVLGFWVNGSALGAYAAASLVASFIQLYPAALSIPVGPKVSELFRQGLHDDIRRVLRQNITAAMAFAAYFFGGVAGFGPNLDLIFGNKFVFPWQLTLCLAFAWLISAAFASAGLAMSMTDDHRREGQILGASVIWLSLLLFLMVPTLGIMGAAFSVLITVASTNYIRLNLVQKRFGRIVYPELALFPIISLISFPIASLTERFLEHSIISTLIACVIYTALYTAPARWFFVKLPPPSV